MLRLTTLVCISILLLTPSVFAIDLNEIQQDLLNNDIRNNPTGDPMDPLPESSSDVSAPPVQESTIRKESTTRSSGSPDVEVTGQMGIVTVRTSLNVRTSAWGSIIGGLPPGTAVEVVGRDGEFLQIRYQGGTAFVHSQFVRLTDGGTTTGSADPETGTVSEPPAGDEPTDRNGTTGIPFTPENIPANGSLTGSEFMTRIANLSGSEREQAIQEAIFAGHIPAGLLQFRSVTQTRRLSDGQSHTIVYRVAPDYLAVGNDADNARIPMNPITAQAIAERMGCFLPTKRMVDQIYAAADTKISPRPMSSGNYPNWERRMTRSEFFAEHDRLVDIQLSGNQSQGLVAGHKKDIVVTNRLDAKPRSVAIYGWHRSNGNPIQPLSTIHENTYADYSHGVRLVAGTCIVDGQEMSLADVMRDPVLSGLVSDEGAIRNPRATR